MYLNKVVEIILEVLVAGMVLGCCWQVITRFVLHNPSKYTEELLRYMLIWLTMMGVPYAYGQNSHLAINLIVKKFKPKNETLAQIAIDVLIMILSVSVMIISTTLFKYFMLFSFLPANHGLICINLHISECHHIASYMLRPCYRSWHVLAVLPQ